MKKFYSCLSRTLFLFALTFPLLYSDGLKAQVQTARKISMTPNSQGYYEYLPAGYSSGSQTYPLILFCHGIGELGNGNADLSKVIDTGLPQLISQGKFPVSFTTPASGTQSFIVISPQFINWPVPTDLNDILNYVLKNYRVNTNRIYITGLSMGGGATWAYAGYSAAYSDRIAAIVPIAGADAIDVTTAGIIANNGIGVWATQNNGDPTVPVSYTINNVAQILAINPSAPVKETIFTASGHDAWTKTYDPAFTENGMNVYEWMLQYQRGTTTSLPPIANAGSDTTIVLPANSVQLNGNRSTAPGGTIASYKWTKISGPSQYTFSDSTIVNPVVSNLIAGLYTFRLTVVNNKGTSAIDDINITVNSNGGYVNIPGKIEAENYSAMSGIKTQPTSDVGGGSNVDYINNGDWLDYNITVASTGNYSVAFRVASTFAGSQIELKKSDGTLLTTVAVPNTGAWQTWTTVTTTVSLTSGSQTIQLLAIVPAGLPFGFNLNWLQFTTTTTTTTPTSGYLPVPGKVEAEDYEAMSGVQTQNTNDAGAGLNVDYINNGDWMDYNLSVSSAGNYSVGFRVAAPAAGSQIQLKKSDGTVLTTINIPATGGWQTWTTVTANLTLASGNQTLRLQAVVPGTGFGFNVNWMQFATVGSSVAASVATSASPYINVNVYGGSNPYNNSEWNNWNIGSQQVSNVSSGMFNYADGTSSTISANLSSSVAVVDNGTGYSGTLAPEEVLRYTSYAAGNRTLTLTGLSGSKKYDLELYASREENAGNSTLFIINGITQTVSTFDNLTQKASFTSLSPDAQGKITISISQTSAYNYLNGFMLTEETNSITSSSSNILSAVITEESSLNSKESLQVYPNPVRDMFVLNLNNSYRGTVNIVIYDVNGSVKKEISAIKDQDSFLKNYNLGNNFASGSYFIKILMGSQSKTIKILKL